jgi:hypothetical protein
MNKEKLKYGMSFWIKGDVYSLVNIIMNLKKGCSK